MSAGSVLRSHDAAARAYPRPSEHLSTLHVIALQRICAKSKESLGKFRRELIQVEMRSCGRWKQRGWAAKLS
jgi:hypothetical protein